MMLHGPAEPGGTARAVPSKTKIMCPNGADGRAAHIPWGRGARKPPRCAMRAGLLGCGNESTVDAIELCDWLASLASLTKKSSLFCRVLGIAKWPI